MKPNYDHMISVLQAAKDGKAIQVRRNGDIQWTAPTAPFAPNFRDCDYRVKPEPREIWLNVYEGRIRDFAYENPDEAAKCLSDGGRTVKYREVID